MREKTKKEYERRVLKTQEHIEQHIGEEIAPANLAKIAGLSLHHFHRVFKGLCGESVMGYTRRIRLETAARQLRTSSRSITDIAFDVGYNSHEAFTRAFQDSFKSSPSAFRNSTALTPNLPKEGKIELPSCPVSIVELPLQKVLIMRTTGHYMQVGALWGKFMGWWFQEGVRIFQDIPSPPEMFARVHDDPDVTAYDKLRYDACLKIPQNYPIDLSKTDAPVSEGQLAAGKYAVLRYKGSYQSLSMAYLELIGRWFPYEGYVPSTNPVIERYLNTPEQVPPEELLTEIMVRIEEDGWK